MCALNSGLLSSRLLFRAHMSFGSTSKLNMPIYLSRQRNPPYTNQGKGDALAQKSPEPPLPWAPYGDHEAYSPLGTPDSAEMMKRTPDQPIPLQDPVVLEVAKKMNKTPAQVLLRYGIQRGMSVVPKSVHAERIKENTDVFDWSLSEEDFKALHTRPNQVRLCHLGFMLNPEGPYKTMEDLWEN